jgi:uncharacterized protein YidB (DUF937 family)
MLGNILAGVMQGMMGGQGAGQGAGAAQANPIAGVLAALLTPQQGQAAQAFGAGGLSDLLGQFRQAGLGAQADSWVSDGPNQPIAPQALESVFGQERLGAMAQEAGMPQNDLMASLARMLPEVINGLTPQGQVPAQEGGMNQMLASVLGSLMNARR